VCVCDSIGSRVKAVVTGQSTGKVSSYVCIYVYIDIDKCMCIYVYKGGRVWAVDGQGQFVYEQALVSLKLKKSIDAEGGRTFAVLIEGG